MHTIATISITIAFLSFFIILADILFGNKQKMMVMNFVWPLTALYGGLIALIVYYTIGRKSTVKNIKDDDMHHSKKPFWQSVILGTLHCGSGCTLGDICAEFLVLFFPVTLFGSTLYGAWLIDFGFAFVIGIIFQYYTIKPMKKLSSCEALKAALKADTLSLTSWQIGMYGSIAIAVFLIFKQRLEALEMRFWFVMQIAMMVGFITAYPVNWWLIKKGIKETM